MEFLKEYLGEELYAQVAEKLKGNDKVALGNLAGGEYVSRHKYADEVADLKKQIGDRDKQLESLKATKDSEMQAKLAELTEANKRQAAEYEKKIADRERDYLITAALEKSGAKNVRALKALLDLEKVSVREGKLEGLQEQLAAVRESDAYLFNAPEKGGAGLKPGEGGKPKTDYSDFRKMR